MNDIKKEQTTTIKIYREFFAKAQAEVKKQLAIIKTPSFCNGCHQCCKIRYTELSPEELKNSEYNDFLETFVPLGISNEAEISLEKNHQMALKIDKYYVEKVIKNSDKDCWFYTCKYLQDNKCQKGKEKPLYCNSYPQSAYLILHKDCGFKTWQEQGLKKLENEMAKDILEKIKNIDEYKNTFSCGCCATCCKIASSEFSYEELKEKAQKGDNFAKQFTSVFIPYEDENEARKYYGEYIDYLHETLGPNEKVYFYHCPKNKDNLCSDYENRPEICKEFPTNPLMVLPKCCAYKPWQEETHTATLLLHALVEIVDFYIKKIKQVL